MKKLYSLLFFALLLSCNNPNHQNTEQVSLITSEDGIYTLDPYSSEVRWVGRELSSKSHNGTIFFTSGEFEITDGKISNGYFIVDMTTINNLDLEGESKLNLEGHLKSDDFFSVEKYPAAILSIENSELIEPGKWNVIGSLTIKGITHPTEFQLIRSLDGWITNFTFDRSMYDVRFRSGTFFQNLGDKLIYDDIELSIIFNIS